MDSICETGSLPCWHILEGKDNKWHVYSKGLRAYGGFPSITDACNYIFNSHPKKRLPIVIQNRIGCILDKKYYPIKKIKHPES